MSRNVVPFADLSTMPPQQITSLLVRAARREVDEMHDRAFWKHVGDTDRAARAEALADFWGDTYRAAMFTIEDRLA